MRTISTSPLTEYPYLVKEFGMAKLDIRTREEVYSNLDTSEIMPLFIRYKNDTPNKTWIAQFADVVSQLSGIHTCYFIHRKHKGANHKDYDELAIKADELPYNMTVQLAKDGVTLCYPCVSPKKMILPEEKDLFLVKKCDIHFVDFRENTFKLINNVGSYWSSHSNDIAQFLNGCFALPIPPIEIQIEEDKEMWQAYLEGLNEILNSKRNLIKVKSVCKPNGRSLKVYFDMDSYAQNLKKAILDKLENQCEQKVSISVEEDRCLISFDGYQSISDETIEDIKSICRDYCYSTKTGLRNSVSGKITIISNQSELKDVLNSIDEELTDFDVQIEKNEDGEFLLSSDNDFSILQKIVEDRFREVVKVVPTTKLVIPLSLCVESIKIQTLKGCLPDSAQVTSYGKHIVVSCKRPLDISLEAFDNFLFSSCRVSLSLKSINRAIEIKGANIKGNAYIGIENDSSQLGKLWRLFNEVKEKYPDQYVDSVYEYAFVPQIKRSVLQQLKLDNYDKSSVKVDVPRSCVYLYPGSEEDYNSLCEDILSQLDDKDIVAEIPKYVPTAKVEFLSEDEGYRRGVFEKVNVVLTGKRGRFTKNKLSKDAKELIFEFNFNDIDERDEVERSIEMALSQIHGVKVIYDNNNNKGVTQWELGEDPSLLNELNRKLQSEFYDEDVNYINGMEYDKLSEVDDDELYDNRFPKDRIIKNKQYSYLKKHSYNIGVCSKRSRDYAIIDVDENVIESIKHKELRIRRGDYIQFPAMGEAAELSRQSYAMNRILRPGHGNNRGPINPNLSNFIFDPKYAEEITVSVEDAKEDIRASRISNLNEKQLDAVARAVLANDLAIIQGPPGTGKTTVIAEIIWQIIRRNPECRILLTSQTNLAVDNALERLQGQVGIRPVRIGNPEKLEPEGRRFSMPQIEKWVQGDEDGEDNAARIWIDRIFDKVSDNPRYINVVSAWRSELKEKDKHSRIEFSRLYKKNVNLVAATCSICGSHEFLRSYNDIFGGGENLDRYFDVVIMDEASKATPLELAVPLVLGRKIIVIGDHKQLPPMMDEDTIDCALEKVGKKALAEKLRQTDSQFKRLFVAAAKVRKSVVSTLDTQYRMHEQIMNTIKQFYQDELAESGGLKCGIIETMDIPDLYNKGSRYHGISLDPIIRPNTHALWIDVKTQEEALNPGYINKGEIDAINLVLRALQQADGFSKFMESQKKAEDKEIGIITFYRAQSRALKKKYDGKGYRIDVVDRFQGMERNIIIVSTVRSNAKKNIGFAKEIERINVAFSRARRLLIVVGNKSQFECNNNYATSIANMETISIEQLKDAVR